jgi:copper chaperone CopZ
MKFLKNITMSLSALFIFSSCNAQIPNAKTESVMVYGNCGMCEKTIEKAAFKKGEAKADWDQDSKMAQITFDSSKTSADAVLQRIAASGYDSEKFTAPDDVYGNLHGCCQYERPKKTEVPTGTTELGAIEKPSTDTAMVVPSNGGMVKKQATTQSAGNPLSEVYTSYFALKNALVASDGSAAATQAKIFFDAVANVKMEVMNPAQHTAWMKFQPKLSADTEKIKNTQKIKPQRESFASLSKNIYEVMKVVKPETAVYYDHCPMYNDGKGGDWLSTEKAIKNPYYGNQMLTCGSVTETLK